MRARMKLVEELDPSHLCCPEVVANARRHEGVVIELVPGAPVEQTWNCWCDEGRHTCKNYLARVPGAPGLTWVAVSTIDIEEGS